MHKITVVVAAFLMSVVILAEPVPSSQTNAAADQEILALERQWMDAVVRKDRRILDTLLADDFLLLGERSAGDRELTDKTRYIENSVTLIEAKSFAFEKTRVQTRGDVAVVHCLFAFEATVKGQPWKSTARITDTWIRERGQWRVLSRHASSLPAAQ